MKKIISFLVALALMVILGANATAASYPFAFANIISPMYSYTQTITATLSFDGAKANCSGAVKPSGNYNCSITVTLYRQNGSGWDYIASWSGSATGGNEASAGGSTSVGSGTYQVIASAHVGGKEFPSKTVTRTKD